MCYLKDDTEWAPSAIFQSKIDALIITGLPKEFLRDDSLGYETGGEEAQVNTMKPLPNKKELT